MRLGYQHLSLSLNEGDEGGQLNICTFGTQSGYIHHHMLVKTHYESDV